MRTVLVLSVAAAALALCACQKHQGGNAAANTTASTDAAAGPQAQATSGPMNVNDMPRRRAGLWKVSTTMDGKHAFEDSQCVGPDTDAHNNASFAGKMGEHGCTPTFSRGIDGAIHFSGSCDMGKIGHMTSNGVVKGDFNSRYNVHVETAITGSPIAAANTSHVMEMEAVWSGPCTPGEGGTISAK
jgi:hypothetical protein